MRDGRPTTKARQPPAVRLKLYNGSRATKDRAKATQRHATKSRDGRPTDLYEAWVPFAMWSEDLKVASCQKQGRAAHGPQRGVGPVCKVERAQRRHAA